MLVSPLADVDVNVPGVIAILAAPPVAQLSVLLVPAFTLVGSAAKEVIVGVDPFCEDELIEPQPTSPAQPNKTIMKSARRPRPKELPARQPKLFLQKKSVASMRDPSIRLRSHPT